MMNSHQPKNKNPLLSCASLGGFEDLSSGIVLATAAGKNQNPIKPIAELSLSLMYFNQYLFLFIRFVLNQF
jgi:hypothetical protein